MKSHQHDFTKGNVWKQLIFFSGPILLASLLQSSYQFIDSLWVGNLLGEHALGAVNVSGTILFVALSLILGINNASLTILSQQKGKGSEDGLRRYINAFVVILTIAAFLLAVMGVFLAEPLLNLLGTPKEMISLGKAYLQINFIGIFFLFGYNFISTVMRALGDSKTPLRFVTIAVLLNAVLDPLFIAVVGWGIHGAAIATVTSQGFAFLYGVIYVLRRKMVPFTIPTFPAWEEVRLIFHLGIPAGLQMAVISAGSAAILSVVTGFGSSVVAGFSAAQRLDSLLLLPAHALSTAVNSMAGQNIGVGNWKRVSMIAKSSVISNLTVMFTIAIIVVFLAEFGVRLFIDDPKAVQFGKTYLQIVSLFFPFLGINFMLNGVVRAAGAMYQVLVLNMISFWVLRFPLTKWFATLVGEIGIGLGIGVSFVISSGFAFAYYRFGKWREKELFQEQKSG